MIILNFRSYFPPERINSSYLTEDLTSHLINNGYLISVYTPSPSRGMSKEQIKKYKKIKREVLCAGKLTVHRFAMFSERNNVLNKTFRYILCDIKKYLYGINEKKTDLIFAGSTPPTQGAMCAMVKKRLCKKQRKHIPFVYNLQDIFPDSLVNAGMTKTGSLLYRIGRKIENYTYNNADKIIVISEAFKRNIMAKGVPEEKIEVIPNWIDSESVKPINRKDNKLFDEFNVCREKFIVLYAGNFGASQGTDVIINAADILKDETDIQFVIFGGGSEFERAKKEIAEKKLSNVILNPLLPAERISEVYSMGDVALITCKRGVGKSGMPSKTWSIMACNTPIIASFDTDSELADILKKSNAGICIEPENSNALAAAILAVKNDGCMPSGGRNYVLNNADKSVCLNKYVQTIEKFKF